MPFKLNISEKGKSWKLETENEVLIGKRLGEKIEGKEISHDLEGYELQITGASDKSGFPHKKDMGGPELKKIILKKGWGMHNKESGLRKRKTVRGNQISDKTIQVNFNILKTGKKHLVEIFPEQNKPKIKEEKVLEDKAEVKKETKQETKEEHKSKEEKKEQ